MCFIHTFLFLNQKKSLYLIQFTQVVSFFKEDYLFMALHIFLSITAIQVNHSIQKRKILIKRRKVLGLNRLKSLLTYCTREQVLQKQILVLQILKINYLKMLHNHICNGLEFHEKIP